MYKKNILKGAEISRKYQVSRTTVTNWKKQAQEYANLELTVRNGKYHIVDSSQNHRELEKLARQAHITNGTVKHTEHVYVAKGFYDIFSKSEQIEIIDDLKRNKTINSKFVYKNKGSQLWNEDYYNLNKPTIKLLEQQKRFIQDVISQPINIVDLGCGNGEPAKWFFDNFAIAKYLGIDGSNTMNKLCESNIKNWGYNIEYEFRQCDFQTCHYSDLTFENKTTNKITLLLGDTLCIFEDRKEILRNISKTLEDDDLFIFDFSLSSRQGYGNFLKHINEYKNKDDIIVVRNDRDDLKRGWILQLLGIDLKSCDIELGFDKHKSHMFKRAVMNTNYVIDFGTQQVELKAGEKIYRWVHKTIDERVILQELEECNLTKVSSVSTGHNCVYICRVKR